MMRVLFTATVLIDSAKALMRGICPAKLRSKFCGHQLPMQTGRSLTTVDGL